MRWSFICSRQMPLARDHKARSGDSDGIKAFGLPTDDEGTGSSAAVQAWMEHRAPRAGWPLALAP
jgi:hypothetical protein